MREYVDCTPTLRSPSLSALTGADVFLKYENQQRTGSFKVRGAYNKLRLLGAHERTRGVIAASAGNHAQGIAYCAGRLSIATTIVMPNSTPLTKVRGTEELGATVVLSGETIADSLRTALTLAKSNGMTFVHPYDDADVIAGQGTIASEMLESFPDLEVLLVPVGGGGLVAGIALAAKHLAPGIDIVGVQSEARATRMTVAEGIGVAELGALPRLIIAERGVNLVSVNEVQIESAMAYALECLHTVVEGAGAAPVAALLAHPDRFRGKRVGIVLSGGNVDTALLTAVAAQARLLAGNVVRARVQINDVPGNLARVAAIIAAHKGNILEVTHQRVLRDLPAKCVALDITIDLRSPMLFESMTSALRLADFPTAQLAMEALRA